MPRHCEPHRAFLVIAQKGLFDSQAGIYQKQLRTTGRVATDFDARIAQSSPKLSPFWLRLARLTPRVYATRLLYKRHLERAALACAWSGIALAQRWGIEL